MVAVATAGALLLTACGNDDSGSGTEQVTLRMVWWGNDARAEATRAAIEAFEAEHSNITVETESLPFDGYFDKLSTQMAANDAPDVQQQQVEFMVQYADQGALLDLTEVDLANLDPSTTETANIDDQQVGVPTGVSTLAVVANTRVFDQAGVPIPDDTTWTWDDYAAAARQITQNSPDGVFGAKSLGWDIREAAAWVAQRGNDLFTDDGQIGAEVEDLAGLYELALAMMDDGGSPSASETSEQLTLAPEQSGVATDRYGMQLDAVSNFPALDNAAGGGLELLRLPSMTGSAADAMTMLVAPQYWSVSARTEHPEEAQVLVDFLASSPEAGETLGMTRSVPANSETRDSMLSTLEGGDLAIVEFMNEISDEVVPTPLAPPGTASFSQNLQRYALEVLFGRQSPDEAAENLLTETEASLQ